MQIALPSLPAPVGLPYQVAPAGDQLDPVDDKPKCLTVMQKHMLRRLKNAREDNSKKEKGKWESEDDKQEAMNITSLPKW